MIAPLEEDTEEILIVKLDEKKIKDKKRKHKAK